jgi:hypothetical protein
MKIIMMKKAGVFLIAAAMVLATATGAFALAYYEAGTPDNNTAGTAMQMGYYNTSTLTFSTTAITDNRAIRFTPNQITGPPGDSLASGDYFQTITGIYSLTSLGGNIYSLSLVTGLNSTIKVDTFLTANALATQINFDTNTIAWSNVAMGSISNTIGSTALDDLAATDGSYSFTNFTFEQLTNEGTWLTGSAGGNARYYSKLEGFSSTPEPAEWMLMFIGLGMLGYYLQRRGYLNFDLSPQSVA